MNKAREPAAHAARSARAWWLQVEELAAAAGCRASTGTAAFRLGDATLRIDTDDDALLAALHALYADCAEGPGAAPADREVRCRVRTLAAAGLVSVSVAGRAPIDLLPIARSLLEPRPGDVVRDVRAPDGCWRMLAPRDRDGEVLLAVDGPRCVLAPAALPPYFLRDLAVATALAAQTSVLFLHAASVAVGGAGVLLAGRSGAGKTTVSLTLAARGHLLLGDDFAALRRDSLELLPMRRTLHVRAGLRARAVDALLEDHAIAPETLPGGHERATAAPSRLFAAPPRPARLQAAFFLRRFSRAPAVAPFTPSLADLTPLRSLPIRHQWGIAPGARFMRFCLAIRLLGQVPCYHLDVGRPEATAALVEATLPCR